MLLDNPMMANSIQFDKWSADQVAEWLRGLDMDDAMIPYMHYFLNNSIDGRKLMLMTHADLEKLNVFKLGHQELILEAIDLLRNLRFGYETENLQSLALQLGVKARGLNGEIRARFGENDINKANVSHSSDSRPRRLSVGILASVADLVATLKSLVAWMDKAPFSGFHDLCLVRNTIVKIGLDLINMCQKESTIPDVEQGIHASTHTLSDICEKLVISPDSPLDPLYVQPASLELATIRKKQGEELGMHILSSYYGVHVISGIKDMSPAELCGKIEKGDEVIQVNHQTVVGWSLKKLVNLLKEKPKEVVLLLKKRPRHITPYGAMPNKKKQTLMSKHAVQVNTLPKSLKKMRSRDGEPKTLRPSLQEFVSSVPSNDEELYSPKEVNDGNDTDNDVFRSGSESPQFTLPVQPDPKQRRATVSGGSPTLSRPLLVIEDIDTPSRPKSFTIPGGNMPHEIIINSPSGDNLADFNKLATAIEKRQGYKTKSTPPSLEFSVRKPTPKIIEPKDAVTPDDKQDDIKDNVFETDDNADDKVEETEESLDETMPEKQDVTVTVVTKLKDSGVTINVSDSDSHEGVGEEAREKDCRRAKGADNPSTGAFVYAPERVMQSPDRLLDSSTDSVPPSESSVDSLQTCTSSLESPCRSPPVEESSLSSEKESSDCGLSAGDNVVMRTSSAPATTHHQHMSNLYQRPAPVRPVQHQEVASDYNKNQPQLVKIRKIDSMHLHPVLEDVVEVSDDDKVLEDTKVLDDVKVLEHVDDQQPQPVQQKDTGGEKKEKHVAFSTDSDKEQEDSQTYVYKVVGGVVQKIPSKGRDSPSESPVVKRRPKGNRTTRINRRVSCKDLGKGDAEGYLYKRRSKGGRFAGSHWKKQWCVIKDYNLYCYHDKEAVKADLMLELQAFQVSPVDPHELKTKKFAFKVHNRGTTFFFASERQEDMSKWMNKLGLASITYTRNVKRPDPKLLHHQDCYSESEEEDVLSMDDPDSRPSSAASSIADLPSKLHDHMRVPSPDLRASTEDLSIIIRKQSQKGVNLFGEDKNIQRRSTLSRELCEALTPEVLNVKRLKSLERTLKAKEKELRDLETALTSKTPEKLQMYRDLANTSASSQQEHDSG